ncbi:MAG: murein hydrolase activator EnvC family protein [Burkholderiales bacterium]
MKAKLLLLFSLNITLAFAVSKVQVNQDLNNLMRKIDQLNHELAQKQRQQQNINQAIDDSEDAINQSEALLARLQHKRTLDMNQLAEISNLLPQVVHATQAAQDNVKLAMTKIYQQIKMLQAKSNSILGGNEALQDSRKKLYLIKILRLQQQKYQALQTKLDQLNSTNTKIENELARLDRQLGLTTQHKKQLQLTKEQELQHSQQLHQQIVRDQQQLANLKDKQAVLNRFMSEIQAADAKARAAAQQQGREKAKAATASSVHPDQSYEDNSPFLARQLARPIEAKVAVPFGVMRGGVRNSGVLLNATNNISVYSISNGKVLYSGVLPGFGQMVVIDNGDNYLSIYGGVLPKVHKGQSVTRGMIIANAGNDSNQPMGGVYFELRHLGKPVDPSKLVN